MPTSHIPTLVDRKDVAKPEDRAEFAASLRAMAEWVETTEFPIHKFALGEYASSVSFTVYSSWYDDEDFVRRVGSSARLIGGKVEKSKTWDGSSFVLTRKFGKHVKFTYQVGRAAVCTPVDVVKEVEVDKITDETRAKELQEELDALKTTAVEEQTVTEWVCPPSLLAAERAS